MTIVNLKSLFSAVTQLSPFKVYIQSRDKILWPWITTLRTLSTIMLISFFFSFYFHFFSFFFSHDPSSFSFVCNKQYVNVKSIVFFKKIRKSIILSDIIVTWMLTRTRFLWPRNDGSNYILSAIDCFFIFIFFLYYYFFFLYVCSLREINMQITIWRFEKVEFVN